MAEKIQSQEALNKLMAGGAEPRIVGAPAFYATSLRMSVEPTNFNFVFSRGKPVEIRNGNELVFANTPSAEVVLDLSPQTAKDLSVLLAQQIAIHEAAWGVIQTPYTRQVEAARAKQK